MSKSNRGSLKEEGKKMGLIRNFMNQTRKPEGKLGKMMIKGMNSGHAKMADWGMAHLHATAPEAVVDLGCGGGRNIGALLQKYPSREDCRALQARR